MNNSPQAESRLDDCIIEKKVRGVSSGLGHELRIPTNPTPMLACTVAGSHLCKNPGKQREPREEPGKNGEKMVPVLVGPIAPVRHNEPSAATRGGLAGYVGGVLPVRALVPACLLGFLGQEALAAPLERVRER